MVRTKKTNDINDMEAAKAPRSITISASNDDDDHINVSNKHERPLKRKHSSHHDDEDDQILDIAPSRKSVRIIRDRTAQDRPQKLAQRKDIIDVDNQGLGISETIEVSSKPFYSEKRVTDVEMTDGVQTIERNKPKTRADTDKIDKQPTPAAVPSPRHSPNLNEMPFKRISGRKLMVEPNQGKSKLTSAGQGKKSNRKTTPATASKQGRKRMIRLEASPSPSATGVPSLARATSEESESSYASSTFAAPPVEPKTDVNMNGTGSTGRNAGTHEALIVSLSEELNHLEGILTAWRREVRIRAPQLYAEIKNFVEIDKKV